MADEDIAEQFEAKATLLAKRENEEIRTVLSDTYTFVRSREINKTIASFTFDHYIDEAKRAIKEDRILRTAANPTEGAGKRPGKLSALAKLENDFANAIAKIRELAKAKDAAAGDR
jgi:hypothetical protein